MKVHIFLLLSLVACLCFTALGANDTESKAEDHLVILYDSSRDIYVMLNDTQSFFNWGIGNDPNANYWNSLYTGTWTSNTRFTDQNGYFEQVQGDNWVEKNPGETNHFVRVQPGEVVQKPQSAGEVELEFGTSESSTEDHLVILYDSSRDIYVMLTDTQSFFNYGKGNDPNGNYWTSLYSDGTWTSNARYTDWNGYFEQAQGENWIEKNPDETHYFVRVQPGEAVQKPQSAAEVELEFATSESSTEDHLVILYDSSREIYVMLTDTQAFFNWGIGNDPDAGYWNLIGENPTGTWTSNTRFTDQTGYFEQAEGDNWVEKQYSGVTNHFIRVQPGEVVQKPQSVGEVELEFVTSESSTEDHLVILYDESRDMYVMLTDAQAFFNWGIGDDPDANYWNLIGENPTGTWTSNTRFTDQTGYFEQAQGDNWVEKQYSGSTNHFVRVQPGEVIQKSQSVGEVEFSAGESELEFGTSDTSTEDHLVILYDSSRDIYVMLTDSQSFFNYGKGNDPNGNYWTSLYSDGTWTSNTRYTDWNGYFEQAQGDNWIEKNPDETHYFVRVQPGKVVQKPQSAGEIGTSDCPMGDHLVILYDESRDMYVMLTDTQAFFNWGIGSDPCANYWNLIGENPTGTWTSSTRFTDQTGYFEQAQGDNWVEKQYSGVTNHFVRVHQSTGELEFGTSEFETTGF